MVRRTWNGLVPRHRDEVRRAEFRRLNKQGLQHKEISERLGVSFTTLWRWSRSLGLQKNPLWDEDKARELYERGLTDPQIAKGVGCKPLTILKWRRRLGLPANYKRRGGPR